MLTLPTKSNWYQMIIDRIKKEEYRADSPYYYSRFSKHEGNRISIIMRNGYSNKSPSALCEVTPVRRKGGNPDWDADPDTVYWVLIIHTVMEVVFIDAEVEYQDIMKHFEGESLNYAIRLEVK